MRKLRRSVARARMIKQGLQRLNKKIKVDKSDKAESFFSQHWQEYA